MPKRIMILLASFVTFLPAAGSPTSAQDCPAPPEEFRATYDHLSTVLYDFNASLGENRNDVSPDTVFAAELLPANGNRGERLLDSTTLSATELYLDRLQELGFGGVTVQISYPLLVQDYPGAQEYLAFYQSVAQTVHERGMKLMVETGPVFAGTIYSDVEVDYSGLTVEDYFSQKRDMLVLIASAIQPDYLALSNEPNTEAMLLGLQFTPAEYVQNVADTLAAIDRSEGMLVGAGAGSWEDTRYFERFVTLPGLDFINIHIYPVQSLRENFLERVVEQSRRASANDKRVIVGETWLYKAQPAELMRGPSFEQIYARDMYCFWSPLDIQFIETIMHLARDQNFEYVSFYWSLYFFSYIEYNSGFSVLPAQQRYAQVNRAAYSSALSGKFSATGLAVQQLLDGGD